MGKSLVIVESDAKSKTINRFLGKEFVVKASVGHVKNLPKNRLGVDLENHFEPEYITIRGRGKILKELKRLATSSDQVYIATDPDREGEAIAHHLAQEIGPTNSNIRRVLFHEITEKAIQAAIQQPKDIDLDKVEAQKARRVMDRLVGYKVSPFLWTTVFRGLSAGRVQSVALRLVCEREDEVLGFKPQEYWTIEGEFQTKGGEVFKARLVKFQNEDLPLPTEPEVEKHIQILKTLDYAVSDLRSKEVERQPYPPYTTSTLQQDASRRLGMTTKQVMAVAQQLYEGIDLPEGRVGLITYMRTDSTRLASSAVQEVREYIANDYGLKYVPPGPRMYKSKKTAQDAHEAVRPTSAKHTPKKVAAYLSPQQQKLYELIWNRFVACQMSSARIEQTTLEIKGGEYLFRVTSSKVKFRGFMQIYEVEKENDERTLLPQFIEKSDPVTLVGVIPEQHFTKPPPRYTESSLVKELDMRGIGRPSTYALIISTLLDRKYIEREGRSLRAAELGMAINRILVSEFDHIFNVDFTAQMETELDQIESGEKGRSQVLNDFYQPFSESIQNAMEKKEEIRESLQEEKDEKCPKCGKDLIIKWGRNGRFIACTGYPDCRYTRPLEEIAEETDERCEKCGEPMVIKVGRFGRFLACSNYPDCKFTKPLPVGVTCPEEGCGGQIVERKSRRGKTFFGCSNYPKCRFATWYRPVVRNCPNCGHPFMEERITKAKGRFLQCPKCKANIKSDDEISS